MKRGKEEEKIMGPMFPRLHINDTEKGGPRAPPRNKMALYEQLSVPSQRVSRVVLPCNPNNSSANWVPPSSQGGGNDKSMFFPRQMCSRYPSEKQYIEFSELNNPLAQLEQRKKLDEDDYRVPTFMPSLPAEFDKYTNNINQEKLASSSPYLHPPSKFQDSNEANMLEQSMTREGNNKNGQNSNELLACWNQTVTSLCHVPGDNLDNSIDRLRTDDSEPEFCAESQISSDAEKRKSSDSEKASPSEDQNIVHDLSNDTGSHDDGSCRLQQTENLERGDSVSEVSVLDIASDPDMTPDDVVGMIGQNHFWKARRAIVNQQRIFAIQVFELHRLIKVQRSIATSPHLLVEDSAYFGKPMKPLAGKKRPLDDAVKANASEGKNDSDNPSHRKEDSAENTVEKASFSSAPNGVKPSSCRPLTGASHSTPAILGSDQNARTRCFNHPQAHQWLIPVMSLSEGLIYKPYPGPGFVGQACGGCGPPGSNPMIGNFLTPFYGIPAPPAQYPYPSFPPLGPHAFYPPHSMPILTTAAFSGSSVEQTNRAPTPGRFPAGVGTPAAPTQENGPVPDGLSPRATEDVEMQASTASSPTNRRTGSRASSCVDGKTNMLTLFPTSAAIGASNASSQASAPEQPTRAIKVVPRNGIFASESAARIFRSIQEERKQYD